MSELKGTEKQIAFAESVRSRVVNTVKNGAKMSEKSASIVDAVLNIEFSEFWIDYREYTTQMIMRELMTIGLKYRGFRNDALMTVNRKTAEVTRS